MYRKVIALILAIGLGTIILTGCASKADVASKNVSKLAEQFKVPRQIVAINGITDKYLMVIRGYCSIESGSGTGVANALEITCAVGKDSHGNTLVKKNYVGLSDNVTYTVNQLDPSSVSVDHYTLLWRPQTVIPDIDSNP